MFIFSLIRRVKEVLILARRNPLEMKEPDTPIFFVVISLSVRFFESISM